MFGPLNVNFTCIWVHISPHYLLPMLWPCTPISSALKGPSRRRKVSAAPPFGMDVRRWLIWFLLRPPPLLPSTMLTRRAASHRQPLCLRRWTLRILCTKTHCYPVTTNIKTVNFILTCGYLYLHKPILNSLMSFRYRLPKSPVVRWQHEQSSVVHGIKHHREPTRRRLWCFTT